MEKHSDRRIHEKIVYVHIHKNAGSTIWGLLSGVYGEKAIKDKSWGRKVINNLFVVDDSNRIPIGRHRIDVKKHKFIFGHFWVDKYLYLKKEGWKFVSWVRDPVDRTISHYDHFRRWYIPKPKGKYNVNIRECFKDPSFNIVKFSEIFSNYQSKFIKDIELFDFIGIVERFDSDYTKFCDMFDFKRELYEIKNINPIERTVVSDSIREIIKKHHQKDYELYESIMDK